MAGVSGLERIKDTGMMHHPHQPRQVDAPGDKFVQILPFNTPAYGQANTVYLPPLDMVVEEAYIEIRIAAVGGTGSPILCPSQTMIGPNGVQLKYDGTTLYTLSEFEAVYYDYLNFDKPNLERRMVLYGDSSGSNAVDASTETTVYVPLSSISDKLLKHIGPLSAYAANKWSIQFDLLAKNRIVMGTNSTAATGGDINSMRLVLIGHREDSVNAQAVSMALAGDGIKLVFSQANHGRTVAASGTDPITVSFSNLAGECTGVIVGQRASGAWLSTAPNAINHLSWLNYNANGDTIEIGTQANPTRIFGQAVPQQMARLCLPSDSFDGSATFLNDQLDWNAAPGTANSALSNLLSPAEKGIMAIALEEKATTGMRYGLFSGALRLNNDFQATFRNATSRTAGYIDIDVLIRRVLVLRHTGFVMVNEE